jgi:isopentenyl diphosphate isomerase/L-lactate dehydrogenase-like FMN-dependent dehydrogenase
MEEVAARMGDVPWWFQLYWSTDEALVDSLLGRAEAAGASAVVVTLDTTMLGWRPRDLDLGSLPFARSVGIAQYTSDPRFRELVAARLAARDAAPGGVTTATPRERPTVAALGALLSIARTHPGPVLDNLRSAEPRAAVETFLDLYSNPGLAWDHLATLRSRTGLPVVLKGVLHPADARRALDLGVDAVVVSNHGGRQVDRSVASLDALRAIRAEVGREPTLLLDSGVRSGADVLVALALGADAVCLGRPNAYGLALAGERGVHEVVSNVLAELDLTMALAGVRSVSDLGPDLLVST